MNALTISLMCGALVFVAIFSSFDRIYQKVWGSLQKTSQETLEAYNDLFYNKTMEQVVRQQSLIGGVAAVLALVLFSSTPLVAVLAAPLAFYFGWRLPGLFLVKVLRPRRIKTFGLQMVDGLTLMGNALKSGMNLSQALKICVDEMNGPISQEFGTVLEKNRIGQSIEQGLENLSKRIPTEDVSMFVTSVNILKETGGNMTETFATITKTIRERIKLQSKIEAMTAQGMTSAYIVSALPWLLGGMLFFIDAELMGPLFFHPAGWAILGLVIFLELIGFFVIVKIVTIRV